MAINFPNSPSIGQLYNFSGTTWQWSGEYWNVYSAQTGYITSVSNSGNGFPVINSVTSNALTLKSFSGTNMTITDSGGQLNFYVPLNGGGGGQLYYFNISKTQTPYLEIATSATTGAEQTITSAATSGNTVTVGQFLTPSGYPGVSIIPAGVWSFYLHSYKQNSSASFDIYCDVYKRTTGGTETLLFSTDPAPVLSDSPTPIMVLTDNYYSGTTINSTDRLLVNVRATNTSNNTYSLTFVSEGTQHYSYFSSPLLLKTTDIYVNSFTYTPTANTITIGQTENYTPQSITIDSFSGLSISNGLTATTISATTYNNYPGSSSSNCILTLYVSSISGCSPVSILTPLNVTNGANFTGVTNFYNNVVFSSGVTISSSTDSTFGSLTATSLSVNGNLTVTGNTSLQLLTATTISATTYQNLPSQSGTGVSSFSYVPTTGILTITKNDTTTLTAGTFSYVTATTLSNNVLSVTSNGNSVTNTTINAATGGTYSSGTITLAGSGTLTTITGLYTGATDIFTTGATYSNNTFTFRNNTGGTFNVLFDTLTGLTINGNVNITGTTTLNILTASTISATTISATTYQNLPSQSGTGVSTFSYAPSTGLLTITKNDTTTLTAGTFTYITATTLSDNILSVTSNGNSITNTTVNAVTGGTFSNGTLVLSGTGNVNGTLITGFGTGSGSSFTGGTVSGSTSFISGLTANTLSATTIITSGNITGSTLVSSQSIGDEGGQINLATAQTNNTLSGGTITFDIYRNRFRVFETGGSNRGVYVDLSTTASNAGTNLLLQSPTINLFNYYNFI